MDVICATDFSERSSRAVVVAARMARRSGDRLVLAHVVETLPAGVLSGGAAVATDLLKGMRDAAEKEMARQVAALRAEGLDVEPVVMAGFAPDDVARLARERSARMIVVGSHERSFAGRLLAGSVADALAAGAEVPVLVVRGESPSLAADVAPQRLRVLCALDASKASDAAVEFLRQLRRSGPVDVVVAHCYWPPGEYQRLGLQGSRSYADPDPEVVAVIERELSGRLRDLPGEGDVTYRIAPSLGRPADPLSRWAEEAGCDLVVVGTHGRRGLARLWHGSVARDLLHVSAVPVVCVPAGGDAAPARIPSTATVLAATDLSDHGDRAVLEAFAVVQPGGRVEIVFVHERPASAPPSLIATSIPAPEKSRIEAELRRRVPRGQGGRDVSVGVAVIEARSAAEGILQEAERLGADAIVVGSRGRTGLAARLLGSAAEAVLRGSSRPVVIVPARER